MDFNELRVTTSGEIEELIGRRVPEARQKSQEIFKALNWLFARYNSLELGQLRDRSKKELRDFFTRVEGLDQYSSAAVLLMSFNVSTLPLDTRMVEYLKQAGVIDSKLNLDESRARLQWHIPGGKAKEMFLLLREHVENTSTGKARKAAGKKKAKPAKGKKKRT